MNFSWAKPYPEIYKICTLFNRFEVLNPTKWTYTPLQCYLQNGPQCGLVALSMLMGSANEYTINKILDYAREMKYSKSGEIFSANFMVSLAEQFLENKRVELYLGKIDDNRIKKFLLDGGFMLVPYDTDKDFSPGFYNGHKAHWCAVSGALQIDEDDFYVIARQGKARNIGIWNLQELSRSNEQLFEFSPSREVKAFEDGIEFIFPEGGMAGPLGLNKKSVLIFNNNNL